MSSGKNLQEVTIGIDVGGSTTKIVGFKHDSLELIRPMFVNANDPITSAYGAFGKFLVENDLSIEDIQRVKMTGVGSSFIGKPIYGLKCRRVSEFTSIGLGGLYLSGLDEAIVVSMGTGTALIHAKVLENGEKSIEYLGGTGVGGGTLVGLSKKMLGLDNIDHIVNMCEGGDLSNIDLRIGDFSKAGTFPEVNENLTAANFGRLSDLAGRNDIALGIVNMVAETVGMMAVFAAKSFGLHDIVMTGNLAELAPIQHSLEGFKRSFGYNMIIPENARYSTVIGAALCSEYDEIK